MPKLVLYEPIHLTQQEKEKANLLLTKYGYKTHQYHGDTLAILYRVVLVI